MDSSTRSEICVLPQFINAIRSTSGPAILAGNNFNLKIDILAKYSYTCDQNNIDECNFSKKFIYKYKYLSWDIVDRELLSSDFPYSLEKVKWDGDDKILTSKDDLIQKILDFARTLKNVMPPHQDDDTVCMSLIFVKHIFVSHQEFELTQGRIFTKHYESINIILWKKVCEEINKLGHGLSLYEEFQSLKVCVEKIVRETTDWRTIYFDENYEMVLIESLAEQARREFRLLPAVRSRMQFLQAVHIPENESIDDCSICKSRYLPGSEAYKLPCNHSFHFGCIETGLLKEPSCPMCEFKLSPTEEN